MGSSLKLECPYHHRMSLEGWPCCEPHFMNRGAEVQGGRGIWRDTCRWSASTLGLNHISTIALLFPLWAIIQLATTMPCQESWMSEDGGDWASHPPRELFVIPPCFSLESGTLWFTSVPRCPPHAGLFPPLAFSKMGLVLALILLPNGYFGSKRQETCHALPDGYHVMAGTSRNHEEFFFPSLFGVFWSTYPNY